VFPVPTTHQTDYLRADGPAAQVLARHGESVVIGGTAYTVTFSARDLEDLDGNTLRVATLRGLAATLPAFVARTQVTRSLDSTLWEAVGPGRTRSGLRIVELHGMTHARAGGIG